MLKIIYTKNEKKILFGDKSEELYKSINNISIDNIAFQFLNKLECETIQGINLENFYIYDNIPLYYFERPTIYLKLKYILTSFMIIKNIIENTNEEVEVISDDEIFIELSEKVFKLNYSRTNAEKENNGNTINKFKLFKRVINGMGSYIKFKLKSINSKDNIIVLSSVININLIKLMGKKQLVDTQIGPLVDSLDKEHNIINFQFMSSYNYLNKSLAFKRSFVPFEFFIIYKKLFGEKIVNPSLITNKLELLGELNFDFQDHNLKDIFMKHVFSNLENRYYMSLTEILCAEKFIKKNRITKLFVTDEGDRPRCFITAGNRMGIKTYALQHGIINEVSPAYMINSKYTGIVPKLTFLWGDKYKDMLLAGSNVYNDSITKVVGQLRTDLILGYNKNDEKDTDKIKILYATQYFKDLLIPATDMLFKALNLINREYEIIIKLHPADEFYNIYIEKIQEYGIKNVKILKDGDLYELLSWSDVVISVHSTVVVEGAILNKPSICIRLPKYDDLGGFIKDGISLGAKEEKEIVTYLDNLEIYSKNNEFIKYLENNFYKIDGKVNERIMNEVD
ncbi:capsule polysaccharide biosynthesis protein [Clostridium homopropionicum DSM 5847]|uniref:Capsule polysaccharide biosynthesis protein n=1 Tax=Clostridium homopropionicum DSM 5847 TaxID=1121318 RepID=A0A0L6ZDS9_9CLOT|nr:capsule polysaccharide biosynthesis protein [Clostridium homopropionicum DSM 5847]SFF96766.1 CDP-Glycerol:Poly(glycerophosphate) glycerophosphotransferase [Clostridium homopropionicum]